MTSGSIVSIDHQFESSSPSHIITAMALDNEAVSGERMTLSWRQFPSAAARMLQSLEDNFTFADVTLVCGGDGLKIRGHRAILASFSSVLKDIFLHESSGSPQEPVVFLQGVMGEDVRALVTFLYRGEVEVAGERVEGFLEVARTLEVDDIVGGDMGSGDKENSDRKTEKEASDVRGRRRDGEETNDVKDHTTTFNKKSKDTQVTVEERTCLDMDIEEHEPIANVLVEIDEVIDDVAKDFKQNNLAAAQEYKRCGENIVMTNENINTVSENKSFPVEPASSVEPWNVVDPSTVCPQCGKQFTTAYSVIEHRSAVHDGIRFPCPHCAHLASSRRNLRAHLAKKHPQHPLPKVYSSVKVNDDIKSKFSQKATMAAKTRKKSKIADDPETEAKIDSMMEKLDNFWRCRECGKTDLRQFYLRHHCKTHTSGFSRLCIRCPRKPCFKTRSALKAHDYIHHRNEERATKNVVFACDLCSSSCVSALALKMHKYRKHSRKDQTVADIISQQQERETV